MDLQERIAAARREADQLKDQIRSRKEKLADTTRELRKPAIGIGPVQGKALEAMLEVLGLTLVQYPPACPMPQ